MTQFAFPLVFLAWCLSGSAADLDTIGVTKLRTEEPALTGAGIRVAQPEASLTSDNLTFEVNPTSPWIGRATSLFTYFSSAGTATNFPNGVGAESSHAIEVGRAFYGVDGVATNVAHVDNYEALFFFTNVIDRSTDIVPRIVNQSFNIFAGEVTNTPLYINQVYDNYAASKNVLFVTGVGTPLSPPATSYNGISVGVYGGTSGIGPTPDNGRSKPDITAPSYAPSYSAPLVAGAAAILLQAALRGDGGNDTAATDVRTLKVLLLNGAVKPTNWTHSNSAPFDTRYGSGVLNVYNSYHQLVAGKHSFVEETSHPAGGSHPPGTNTNSVPFLSGWDFDTITNPTAGTNFQDQVRHYYFDLPSTIGSITGTVTVAWNRPAGQTNINDLDLFLVNSAGTPVAVSTSTVDNVEHLFVKNISPGRYDLQVLKNAAASKRLSPSETYALAFEFFQAVKLKVARSGNKIQLSWPLDPSGFALESTPDLSLPVSWSAVQASPSISNGFNFILQDTSSSNRLFRLRHP